jgi:hypothetical protein
LRGARPSGTGAGPTGSASFPSHRDQNTKRIPNLPEIGAMKL